MKRAFGLVVAAACLASPLPCLAQGQTQQAVAEALYQQARDLMAAGKLDEACPKFAESQRLDPATGTLLNLAACHERQGKLASAWLEYSDAQVAARRDDRPDRVEFAAQRAAALSPRLSRLTLVLGPGAEQPGLTLELDGLSVGSAAIGAPTPVDPGKHTVRATAPGKKPWVQGVEIGAEADQQSLTIPQLEDGPPEPAAAPSPPATPGGGEASRGSGGDELRVRPVPTSVYVMGGVTAALAVGAGVTGLAYLNKRETYKEGRPDGPSTDLQNQYDSAERWGYVNIALWAATACSAGVTTYLYVTRPTRSSSAQVVPWAGPHQAGLSVAGGF